MNSDPDDRGTIGDLRNRINQEFTRADIFRSQDEFTSLNNSVMSIADGLKEMIDTANDRLDQIVNQIQK